ncbi:UNVERIFIED_CONTAM: hypothetical protein Slati_3116700 [Sesamum latifolium]|uniref:Uncharacterized protein n=1 Tax=Sesamum latifolium TaxID=2727402 RepID=A0AAW2UVH5_9LAMI
MGTVTGSEEIQIVPTPSKTGLSSAQHNHVDSVHHPISNETSQRAPIAENPSSNAEIDSGGSLAVSKPFLAGCSSTPYGQRNCLRDINPNPNSKGADEFDAIHWALRRRSS